MGNVIYVATPANSALSLLPTTYLKLEGKYSLESTDPRESEICAPRQLTIALKRIYYRQTI